MEANLTLGDWIIQKYGKKGGKSKFADKIGADPTLLSKWLGGAGVSEEYQAKIRKLGYQGPWPRDERVQRPDANPGSMSSFGAGSSTGYAVLSDANAPAPAGGPYVTEREFGKLEGRVEDQEKDIRRLRRRLQEAFVLIQDLGRRAGIELPPVEPVE